MAKILTGASDWMGYGPAGTAGGFVVGGKKYVHQVAPRRSGNVVRAYLMASLTNLGNLSRAVIYSDVAGAPSALLGSSDERGALTARSWNLYTFSVPVALVAGTSYWIGIHADQSINSRDSDWYTPPGGAAGVWPRYYNTDVYPGATDPFGAGTSTPTATAYGWRVEMDDDTVDATNLIAYAVVNDVPHDHLRTWRHGPPLLTAYPSVDPDEHTRWRLEASSVFALNREETQVTGGPPSIWQPTPSTAADLIKWMGSPAGWVAGDIAQIWQMKDATNQNPSIGATPVLVRSGASVLTQREFVGFPGADDSGDPLAGAYYIKKAVELHDDPGYLQLAPGNEAFADPNNSVVGFLAWIRVNPDIPPLGWGEVLIKYSGGVGWDLEWGDWGAGGLTFFLGGYGAIAGGTSEAPGPADGSAILVGGTIDDIAGTVQVWSSLGAGAQDTVTGSMHTAVCLAVGSDNPAWPPAHVQVGWLAFTTKAITQAIVTAFDRACKPGGLCHNVALTHTRASSLMLATYPTPGTSNYRVVSYNSSQVAMQGLSGTGASLKGALCLTAARGCLGIDSRHPTTWLYEDGVSHPTAYTGPDGLYGTAVVVVDTDAAVAKYVETAAANLVGATNVKHNVTLMVQAVVGTAERIYAYFSGDPGGSENLLANSDAPSSGWLQRNGTCTPTRAAHTAATLRLYPTNGTAASQGTVRFSHPALYVLPLGSSTTGGYFTKFATAHTDAGTATALAATTVRIDNTGPLVRFNPARGHLRVRGTGGFIGEDEDIIHCVPSVGDQGRFYIRLIARVNSAPRMDIAMYDGAGVRQVFFQPLASGVLGLTFDLVWDARVPVVTVLGTGYHAALYDSSSTTADPLLVDCQVIAPWTPAAPSAVPDIYIGSNGAANYYDGPLTTVELLDW